MKKTLCQYLVELEKVFHYDYISISSNPLIYTAKEQLKDNIYLNITYRHGKVQFFVRFRLRFRSLPAFERKSLLIVLPTVGWKLCEQFHGVTALSDEKDAPEVK
ncbi:predicted protein [Botrytis cinerea T4]|uniref:Uncharacterized protein n=1 Tax=Botryotinia fuckeliana (strain T4) TaxID=999810 RepID=G2YFW4_BOTF4|nr:predicted protein [Botrytis cinerea T4]